MSDFIMWLDNLIWSTPLIILTFGSALIFCFAMKFGNITKIPLQWSAPPLGLRFHGRTVSF